MGLAIRSTQTMETSFDDSWCRASSAVSSPIQKKIKLSYHPGCVEYLETQNECVFNGIAPRISIALTFAGEECQIWSVARGKGLSFITASSSDS